ncbi:MAG: copper amine oxidase N-terminal domain-containing protein [Clostridia bacterium]|nr:copper amine oxidase N-terminal domain-containing protein [Clostridia bacterium]
MRKITLLALTAAITFTSAVNVQAAGRVERIYRAAADNSQINILYNDTIVDCDGVKPVNADGRVMIPFRTALENMGASVEYDNAHKLVTAKKDDIIIKFTLMDDMIYIDRNGEQSTLTMDVPMMVVDGSTLVPIRFMSNALDMRVGWDGDSETVIIMDYDGYFKDFENIMPNMNRLFEMKIPDFNSCSELFDIDVNYSDNYDTFNFSLKGTAESGGIDSSSRMNILLNTEFGDISLEDAKADVIFDDGKLYIKTDILEHISKNIDDKFLKFAAVTFNGITWYKLDLDRLTEEMGLSASFNQTINSTGLLKNYMQLIMDMVSQGYDVDMSTAVMAASMFDTWEEIDPYISVTEKKDGGYTVKLDISPDDFNTIIKNIGASQLNVEDMKMIEEMIKFTCSMDMECDGVKQTSDIMIDVSAGIEDVKLSLKMKFNEKDEVADEAQTVTIPAESVDITDTVLGFIK